MEVKMKTIGTRMKKMRKVKMRKAKRMKKK